MPLATVNYDLGDATGYSAYVPSADGNTMVLVTGGVPSIGSFTIPQSGGDYDPAGLNVYFAGSLADAIASWNGLLTGVTQGVFGVYGSATDSGPWFAFAQMPGAGQATDNLAGDADASDGINVSVVGEPGWSGFVGDGGGAAPSPDILGQFTISRSSDGGLTDPWTTQATVSADARFWDDPTDPASSATGRWWYRLTETTQDGVPVPYNTVSIFFPPQPDPYAVWQSGRLIPWANGSGYSRQDYQWHLKNTGQPSLLFLNGSLQSTDTGGSADIGAMDAWALLGESVTGLVGLVDSGLDPNHPDLIGVVQAGTRFNLGSQTSDYTDTDGHGTRMAGLIAGRHNGSGIMGIADGVKLLVAATGFYHGDMAKGIVWCVENGAKIINVSWVTGEADPELLAACTTASDAGCIIVCACPNTAESIDTSAAFPCNYDLPGIVPVTNSTREDVLYNPAAWGANVLAAPGRNIVSSARGGGFTFATGCSESAAIVSGALAWLWGKFPAKTRTELLSAVNASAVPIDYRIVGRVALVPALRLLA